MSGATILIRVISLSNSPRRAKVEEALAPAAMPWSFFDALRQDEAEPRYDREAALALWGRELSAGEIGCFASHVAVLRDFVAAASSDWLLVIEDDVLLDLSFPFARLAELGTRSGIAYFRLYGRYLMRFRHVGWFADRQIVRFRGKPLGTQAYLISRAGARAFIGSIDVIERPIDHEIDRAWANGLDCYAVYPHPAFEVTSASTVVKRDIVGDGPWSDRARRLGWRVAERMRREWRGLKARRSDERLRRELSRAAHEMR